MITMENIHQIVEELVEQYQSRNPFEIAKGRNITLVPRYDFEELKGAYVTIFGKPFIFLNANLEDYICRYVCAHELGHDVLDQGVSSALFTFDDQPYAKFSEKRANQFAAHLLLSDEEMDEMVRMEYTYSEIAQHFCVDENLVLLKLKEMEKEGYPYRVCMEAPSPFFLR